MKRKLLLIMMLLLLSGCVQTLILDELQLVHSIGYDYVSDHQVEGTASIPIYKMQEQVSSETISATAATSKDIRLELNSKTSRPLHTGKVSSILFNQELATKMGLMPILDTFARDPTIGMRNYVCLISGSVREILETTSPLEIDIAIYIQQTIEQNIERQNIPKTNFHMFLKQYYEVGQDPYLPHLKKTGNNIEVDGVALLKGDRYVDKLGLEESFLMKMLLEPFSNGTYEISLEKENEFAVLRNIYSQAEYTIEKNTNTPKIDIVIQFKGKVNEYSGERLDEKKLQEIKTTLKKQLERDSKKVLGLFQEKHIDPLGIGSRVKSVNSDFNLQEWEDYYPNANINITADITITESGIRE